MNEKGNIKNENSGNKKDRVWIHNDGIIRIFEDDPFDEQDIKDVVVAAKRVLGELGGKGRILIKITNKIKTPVTSSETRKELVKEAKNIIKDPGFERAAIYGGSLVSRTVASFIITAIGLKNIKIFATKEKALEWLKNP